MSSRICIIGHGGLSPALREAILITRQVGLSEVFVVTENGLTNEDLDLLASEYDVKARLVDSLQELDEGLSVTKVTTPKEYISSLIDVVGECSSNIIFESLDTAQFKTVSSNYSYKEKCYPRIPPRKLGAGKRR